MSTEEKKFKHHSTNTCLFVFFPTQNSQNPDKMFWCRWLFVQQPWWQSQSFLAKIIETKDCYGDRNLLNAPPISSAWRFRCNLLVVVFGHHALHLHSSVSPHVNNSLWVSLGSPLFTDENLSCLHASREGSFEQSSRHETYRHMHECSTTLRSHNLSYVLATW